MKVSLKNGRPAIFRDSGELLVCDITCGLRYPESESSDGWAHEQGAWTLTEDGEVFTAQTENARLVFRPEGNGMSVVTEYTYGGKSLERTDSFVTFAGRFTEGVGKAFGSDMRECNGNKTNEMLTDVYTLDLRDAGTQEFGDFCAFHTVSGKGFILGYLTANEYFSGVYLTPDGLFESREFTEHHEAEHGKVFKSDVFYITECDDIVKALPEYSDLVVKHMNGKPRIRFETPSGYCTWYYYLAEINEKIISRAVEDMAENKENIPVKYIQIDDGWQVCYGQWEPNEKFPQGMKAYADSIREAGFTPGLWFAPLWARIAKVATEHPEYFARDRETGEQTVCFDYSVPGACEFMGEVFRRATYDWGFKYLKLDLITTCLGAYRYSDPDFNSLKNYRKCMQIINESVPEDTFILGCTAPFMPSVGLVDGMRVSCDIFEDWNSLKDVMRRVLKRYHYHKRFFINDADCLIIRKSENEDEECQRWCKRNDEEIRSYISATAASGGILMLSDKLRLLDRSQIKQVSYLFPQNTDAAVPLDLMESDMPCILDCGTKGKIRTVILINWTDEEKQLGFELDTSHVFEFWSGKYKGILNGRYESRVAPHCCEVLFVTEAHSPAVIATDSTLIPAISQDFEDGQLRVRFEKAGEKLYVAANAAECEGCRITKVAENLYVAEQTGAATEICLSVR